jgi:hypothetical protein
MISVEFADLPPVLIVLVAWIAVASVVFTAGGAGYLHAVEARYKVIERSVWYWLVLLAVAPLRLTIALLMLLSGFA